MKRGFLWCKESLSSCQRNALLGWRRAFLCFRSYRSCLRSTTSLHA